MTIVSSIYKFFANHVFLIVQIMLAGQEYDYFFEVDGEIRYDFDCDSNQVEIAEQAMGMGTQLQTELTPGQIIIANSILIG